MDDPLSTRSAAPDEDIDDNSEFQMYGKCVALMLDAPGKRKFGKSPFEAPCPYRAKYDAVRKFLKEYTTAEVRDVYVPPKDDPNKLLDLLDTEVKKLGKGDLLVAYYYGKAGNRKKKWSWKLRDNDNGWVNGCAILEKLCQASDCLFMMDCKMPTSWPHKMTAQEDGVAEILSSRGLSLTNPDGDLNTGSGGDFTYATLNTLSRWVTEAKTTYKNYNFYKTIPLALKADRRITDHPDRIKYAFKGGKKLHYVRISPGDIRATGKIRFFRPARVDMTPKAPTIETTIIDVTQARVGPLISQTAAPAIIMPPPALATLTKTQAGKKRDGSAISADDEGYNSDSSSSILSKNPRQSSDSWF